MQKLTLDIGEGRGGGGARGAGPLNNLGGGANIPFDK